jgi:hypothetical protein
MKVTMVLADYAQAAEGKLNVIGAGWTLIGPQPSTFAIGLIFDVPWDRANEQLDFRLELVDQDGQPISIETPEGTQPVVIAGGFEVGRPPGVKRGTPLTFPVAINLAPHPLPPGGRYEWRLTVGGESHEDWRLPFSTRPGEWPPPTP